MKKIIALILSTFLLTLNIITNVFAAIDWPSNVGIQSEAAIVMDVKSGAVIWGQNIHQSYYPASITKILTALIILENCKLDDMITFSKEAVYDVESGSSSAGYDVGDSISVKDALYAMLLKSANEVANALAEHCSGSVESFTRLMNEKAKALGCTDSNFANPSGLNNENHYTSAYDFALIASAAFKNPTLTEIAGARYYELQASKNNPEKFTVYAHHAMLRRNSVNFYEFAVAGKTGYTMLAGNTLVTFARKGDMELVSVVLKSKQTHYSDTKALLEFGFNNFKTVAISQSNINYDKIMEDVSLVDSNRQKGLLQFDTSRFATLPKNADINDATTSISYELSESDPKNAVAAIDYFYNDRKVGRTYLLSDFLLRDESAIQILTHSDNDASSGIFHKFSSKLFTAFNKLLPNLAAKIIFIIISVLLLALCIFLLLKAFITHKEHKELELLRAKRRNRQLIDFDPDSLSSNPDKNINGSAFSRQRRKKSFFSKFWKGRL